MVQGEVSQLGAAVRSARGAVMVIFGASGDLTHRKLIPALYNIALDGLLPKHFKVIGVSRSPFSDQEFREKLKGHLKEFSRRPLDERVWQQFAECIHYLPMDVTKKEQFGLLQKAVAGFEEAAGGPLDRLFYLSTAPEFFGPIAEGLGSVQLHASTPEHAARIVVEKPFGHDLVSARALNALLLNTFNESQIYRIDHYLGKETVQNILVFRFANGIFEPMWSKEFVDHIQITVAEDIGLGSRAGYFDTSGISRDFLQNHVLQMLALLCIESPLALTDPNSIRDEKVKVLRSIKRFSGADIHRNMVRAQYGPGLIRGEKVPGYLEEKGVAARSQTESFIACKFEIDNWRWQGVPIYVRVGKRLPKRITELAIYFKQAPHSLFRGREVEVEQNVLAIQIQPQESISLKVMSKPPGPRLTVQPVVMNFSYGHSFGVASADAYERLILDAMKGDPTLFIRGDEIEESWSLLDQMFKTWNGSEPPPLYTYDAGSWGPKEAYALLERQGHSWRRL